MIVWNPNNDTLDTHTLSGPYDSDTRSVTITASGNFIAYSVWLIVTSTALEQIKYRITGVTTNENMSVKIDGMQYIEDAYYHTDYESGGVAI